MSSRIFWKKFLQTEYTATTTPLQVSTAETVEDDRFEAGGIRQRSKTRVETSSGRMEDITTDRTTILFDREDPQSLFSSCQTATSSDGKTDETCFTTSPSFRYTQTRADGRQEITELDNFLRPVESRLADPDSFPVFYKYDSLGRPERQTHGEDPATLRETIYDYDPATGYTRSVTSKINATRNAVTQYTYDPSGRVETLTPASGQTITFGYDPVTSRS